MDTQNEPPQENVHKKFTHFLAEENLKVPSLSPSKMLFCTPLKSGFGKNYEKIKNIPLLV